MTRLISTATNPMPFQPEPLDVQAARYPLAVDRTFDVVALLARQALRPGECRRCVFDSFDGVRLIVSREILPDLSEMLHLSASLDAASDLYSRSLASDPGFPFAAFLDLAHDRFRAISGDTGHLIYMGRSDRGIPHWYRPRPRTPR
jgi:hypothetical protein